MSHKMKLQKLNVLCIFAMWAAFIFIAYMVVNVEPIQQQVQVGVAFADKDKDEDEDDAKDEDNDDKGPCLNTEDYCDDRDYNEGKITRGDVIDLCDASEDYEGHEKVCDKLYQETEEEEDG